MDYKSMLSKLSIIQLKQIIKQYMTAVKIVVSKKSKEELIEHILKHTEFRNNKITIKSHDDVDIETPKMKEKKQKMVQSKAPKVEQFVESKPPKRAEPIVKKTKDEQKKEADELIMKMAQRSANRIKSLLIEFEKDKMNKTKRKALARAFDNASASTRAVLRKEKNIFEKLQKISNDVKMDLDTKKKSV